MSDAANLALMRTIHGIWGAEIAQACAAPVMDLRGVQTQPAPASFVAGLIANESGGNPDARRFEKGVLAALWEVLAGRAAAYGSIGRADLLEFVAGPAPANPDQFATRAGTATVITDALLRVDSLATSWGPTQIMGYEALVFRTTPDRLKWPNLCLLYTQRMLADFVNRWKLNPEADFQEMFRCWNTGRAHNATTADPNYVPNGVERMKIYAELLLDPPGPQAVSA